MKKRFLALSLVGVLGASGLVGCGLGPTTTNERSDVSYLYVNTNQGGFGDAYLKALEKAFETEYAQESFATGKTGVDLVIAQSDNAAKALFANMANSSYNVHIVEGLYYTEYAAQNYLLDLNDVVKAELKDGSGTIESKLFDDQKEALTATEDKHYYALPVFSGFNGLTYDAALFEEKGFYFADEEGAKPETVSSYTGKAYTGRGFADKGDKKSCGPDGRYNTYDDGLPSTYEEFFYLCEYMVASDIIPCIWTGASMHYTNYLFQALLSANSTKTELVSNFTFDSGDEEIEIVESFTNGVPNIVKKVITPENGYDVSQSYNRYLALKFLEEFFNAKYYHPDSESGNFSNHAAQQTYEESSLRRGQGPVGKKVKPIAMMIEGNYWYNEASGQLKESVTNITETAKNRNFRYMPLPGVETGTVDENKGSNIALCDSMYYYMIVNSNIKDNAEKVKLAKAFVEFFYRDSSLQAVTMSSGVPCALKYDLTQAQYDSMDNYPQSLWDVYKYSKDNEQYATPLSSNSIFLKNTAKFSFKTTGDFFDSRISESIRSNPFEAFKYNSANAEKYFTGMKITENVWKSTYNK